MNQSLPDNNEEQVQLGFFVDRSGKTHDIREVVHTTNDPGWVDFPRRVTLKKGFLDMAERLTNPASTKNKKRKPFRKRAPKTFGRRK